MNHVGNILHVSAEFLLRNYQCMIIKIVVMDFICINLASFSFILLIKASCSCVCVCVKVCVELSCVLLRKVRQIQTSVVRGKVVISNGSASIYTACVG